MLIITIMAAAAILGGILADRKHRSVAGWVILCFLLPICVLFILALKPLPAEIPAVKTQSAPGNWECPQCKITLADTVDRCPLCKASRPVLSEPEPEPAPEITLCPYCREEIKVGAVRCKHCRKDFDEPAAAKG